LDFPHQYHSRNIPYIFLQLPLMLYNFCNWQHCSTNPLSFSLQIRIRLTSWNMVLSTDKHISLPLSFPL
jgi:hypothetical protein